MDGDGSQVAVTPGNKKVHTHLRVILHIHEWGHIVWFFFFLLVQVEDFNTPILDLDWDSTQKTGKDIQAINSAIGISDYITMAIYVRGLKFTKSRIIFWKFKKNRALS